MHSLNPFLRAFFKSTLLGQCVPVNAHVLLVPTTECLLTGKDRESESTYLELASSEDFLASHILRIPTQSAGGNGNIRESRSKAKQYSTVNGRTVVVKESFVYANKGFRSLNQTQILGDQLHYSDNIDVQQWLVYHISHPLIGSYETIRTVPACLPLPRVGSGLKDAARRASSPPFSDSASSMAKKDIKTFTDLLNHFPLVARQMHAGLEKIFREFARDSITYARAQSSRRSSTESYRSSTQVIENDSEGISPDDRPRASDLGLPQWEKEESALRASLETAVTAAIDLFQQVDQQQLSVVGATTDLTGPAVENLIERYITERLHDSTLLPSLKRTRRHDDLDLDCQIRGMQNIDVAQVGISIENGRQGKTQLMKRICAGVEQFRKLGSASSPQQMMDILLTTQKIVTAQQMKGIDRTIDGVMASQDPDAEKPTSVMTVNADTLVSLLLMVVIRSQVRNLNARLAYMRNFIFTEDVEGGELGYALSTFEAVLSYLATDSTGLKRASRRNQKLWQAIKAGDVYEIRAILESSPQAGDERMDVPLSDAQNTLQAQGTDAVNGEGPYHHTRFENTHLEDYESLRMANFSHEGSSLAHVFPFQTKRKKRVSMDMRSLSNISEHSFLSRTNTLDSMTSAIESDTSITTLSQTQDIEGHSVLMMAVAAAQPLVLEYLLSLDLYFPVDSVLADTDQEGTTLLSAAVQSANYDCITVLLRYLFASAKCVDLRAYIGRPDVRGRSAAHYLFHAPYLLSHLQGLVPWTLKDKIGQTPLLALCRSYDHPHYSAMVNQALQMATDEQGDGEPLHLDNHVDSKGNTLLHVLNEASLAIRILRHCDADPNAKNDKHFTPLMVASKYGRMDMVRILFADQRVDIGAKELRGMTAVELAKDDEVRNRIDDMVLVSNRPSADGRVTAVVRSFFVDDASVRMIIKSAAPSDDGMIGVTTCRRSLNDFENLAKWLAVEHPASWLPSIFNFRSPFQINSRPSRAVLQDIQLRLDRFLKIMLTHSTFSTHELLWEFILFPEIQPDMMAERSRKKAEIRIENIGEDLEPLIEVREVSSFVEHARETIRPANHAVKSVMRRTCSFATGLTNLSVSLDLCAASIAMLQFLPQSHLAAFTRFAVCAQPYASDPYTSFYHDFAAISATSLAILSSLARPHSLIVSLAGIQKAIDRHASSTRRSDKWPLGLLEETRKGFQAAAQDKAEKGKEELRAVGCDLRYTQQTVAGELAGWQDLHAQLGRRAIRDLAQQMVVREKDRLDRMRRAIRGMMAVKTA